MSAPFADAPALAALLGYHPRWSDGMPWGCSGCPYASAAPGYGPPNPDDPDEGYYHCALIPRARWRGMGDPHTRGVFVWGESPDCLPQDWQQRAAAELLRLLGRPALPRADTEGC